MLARRWGEADSEVLGGIAHGSADCPLDEQDGARPAYVHRRLVAEAGEVLVIPALLEECRYVLGSVAAGAGRGLGAMRPADPPVSAGAGLEGFPEPPGARSAVAIEDTGPGGAAGPAGPGAAQDSGQGRLPSRVVDNGCRYGQQPGCGHRVPRGPVDGGLGACAQFADMLADQRLIGGSGEVPGSRPGDAEHRRGNAQVGEVGGGVLCRIAGVEHGEHAPLERERFRSEVSRFGPRLVEPLPAGLSPAPSAARAGERLPALGRVQAAVAGHPDQQRVAAGCCRMILRAADLEREPVARAGEYDRELPGEFPASAELVLDGAAVAGQAARAVAELRGEQPVVGLRPRPGGTKRPGDRRIAVSPGNQGKPGCLGHGEPGELGKVAGIQVQQQPPREAPGSRRDDPQLGQPGG